MALTLPSRPIQRLLAVLIVAALAAAVGVPAVAETSRWVVPTGTALPSGSIVVGSFPLADALIVTSPTAPEGGVSYDEALGMRSLTGVDADGLRVDSGVATTRAGQVWHDGELGSRAVVALIDTGVAPVAALEDAVVGEIDFSGTGGGDGYGHGTFLASLIAGAGPDAPGVAPQAGILSLKVGRTDGTATLGSVLTALQWMHSSGRVMGVRIATLALGVDPASDAGQILDTASDSLARSGVMVITAAGNDGAGKLSSPATAKDTFSVGAVDDHATADRSDDTVADFSGSGPDSRGVQQPDVMASGSLIVGVMPADSVIARENPQAWVADGLFRGSGTSMATALTAGVAALASSARPDLDGDALTAALRAGEGVADAPSAVAAAKAAAPGRELPTPGWADQPVEVPGQGRARSNGHAAEADPNGVRWTGVRWTGVRWTGVRWTGVRWTGVRWTGVRWTGVRWTGVRWTGNGWGDETWGPGAWGGVRWTGSTWAADEPLDGEFAGVRWTGVRWTGVRWTGVRWTGVRWTGVRWTMLEAPGE